MSQFFRQSLLLYAVSIAGLTLSLLAFWPGFMEYDSFVQYGQAIGKLPLDNWHPVSMTILWRALISIYDGPQPMLVLQMFLYWAGFLYLAWHLLYHTSRLPLALSAIIVPFFPFLINFSGVIWKDTHLAISLFWASLLLGLGKPSRSKLMLGLAFIFYAISVRHNGIAAALPIMVLWSYQFVRLTGIHNKYSIPLVTLSISLGYLLINLSFSTFISFEKTSPLNAQLLNEIIFIQCQLDSKNLDIINNYYGENLIEIDPKNRTKYLCNQVSLLAKTEDTNVIYDEKILESPDYNDPYIRTLWAQNVRSHPLSYLKYRLKVYITFLRPLNYPEPYYVFLDGMDENPLPFKLNFKVLNPFELTKILNDYIAFTSSHIHLLFRPFFWLITLFITTLFLLQKRRYSTFLVALSGLLYLILYFPFLPAPDFRFCYYSIFAQIISIFIFLNQCFSLSSERI